MRWLVLLFLLLVMPTVAADCSLDDLPQCLPSLFLDFILDLVNAPLGLILGFIENLLTAPMDPNTYAEIWAIIVYVISMFYGLLLVYSGVQFIFSGYDSAKREQAKSWLRNIVIMVFLVQASFLIYAMILDINSALTTAVFDLIDPDFFVFSADSFSEVAMEMLFGAIYLVTLVTTMVILIIRHLVVSFGVVLFPLGIFLYFTGPLRGIGKAVLNFLFINIFMSFIASLVLLIGSMIIDTSMFSGMKMAVMIATFALVDVLLFYFLMYGLIMAAIGMFMGYKTFAIVKVAQKLGQKGA